MAQPEELESASRYNAGDLIGDRYRLLRPLSRGGMGELWVAHSLALDIKVAVKILHGSLAGTEASERMAREARAVARLGHPAIVRVMDFGHTEHKYPYIVSELLEGEDLAHNLDGQGRLGSVIAVRTILPIVDAVWTAHEKGIVHRDLKPDNIFLSRDEQKRVWPKVLDFGIAKLLDGDMSENLTEVGLVVGSPAYMSPEQSYGTHAVDHRTDIWSIGVLLYEMATGTLPFAGASYHALVAAIVHDVPIPFPMAGLEDQDELWRIIEKCLRKDPAERYASMRDLGEALAEWLHDRAVDEDICGNSVKGSWLKGLVSDLELSGDGVTRAHAAADVATQKKNRVSSAPLPVPLRAGVVPASHSRPEGDNSSRTMLYAGGSAAVTLVVLLVGYAAMSSPHETVASGATASPGEETLAPAVESTAEAVVEPVADRPEPARSAEPVEVEPDATASADVAASASVAPVVAPRPQWKRPPLRGTNTQNEKKSSSGDPDFGF